MNKSILKTGVQDFIKNKWDTDIMSLLLKKPLFEGISQKELVGQMEARKRSKNKLPTWFDSDGIYYPNKLNIEQCSSEETASYKSELTEGNSLLDVTGGFGVDSYYFSRKITSVAHCEITTELSEIVSHNFKILEAKNIVCHNGDGIAYLQNAKENFDWIYIDPSRRSDSKGKVFLLKDCLPDVPNNLHAIFQKTKNVLIKTSPLLDISKGIHELVAVKEIHVVAVKNEAKELLWVLEKGYLGEITIKTINLNGAVRQSFDFLLSDEKDVVSSFETPSSYLYEPNTAILKSGGFKSIGQAFGLAKLHEHSHLFTSNNRIDFPGRVFHIAQVFPYGKKEMKQLALTKANITTRNFPESVDSIRKKFKIKDGGEDYLFFTTNCDGQLVVIRCKK